MRRLVAFVAVLLWVTAVEANPVTRGEASSLAAGLLKQRSVTEVETPFDHLYVFNADNGFVIVSSDDRVLPVLGYSSERQFDTDMAESTYEWLRYYDDAVRDAVESDLAATDEIKTAWRSLREDGCLPVRNRSAVGPLVVTTWNQRSPYNMYCPQQSLTGCVATAMSQIMKYWEYPRMGAGQHSYYHSVYGQLSANFGATSYDWDNMLEVATDNSPNVVKQAVATLNYQCGVSVEMNYSPDFSASFSTDVINAMTTYFKYATSMSLESKDNYSDAQWKSMLKGEINASRPVYYDGSRDSSGHAFICDGYDASDYFHFNWGWGGSNNGYYLIGALNPGSNTFNLYNRAIIGIQPSGYTLSPPTGLNAVVDGRQVNLSWSGSVGANYYKVYRDGMLIAPVVSLTHYGDTPDYGSHSYYVKAIGVSGDRSARSNIVEAEVLPAVPAPVDLKVEMEEDALSLIWSMPFGEAEPLAYGNGGFVNSMGYNGAHDTYWGQRYPKSVLSVMAGMTMTKVSVYFRYPGSYTLYVGKGNSYSVGELVLQKPFSVSAEGWRDIALDTPMPLDYTGDMWVVLGASSSINYPAAYCSYEGPGLEDASYISTGIGEITAHSYPSNHISWMIKVILSDEAFTYSVSRDGTLLATGLSERSYTDSDVTTGFHSYRVWTTLNGVDSDETAIYETELVYLDVISADSNAGSVEGGGLAELGSYVTVTAYPNPGYLFMQWRENGLTVSTEQEYSFNVSGDRQLQAVFSGWGVDEADVTATVLQVEVYTLNGVKILALNDEVQNWEQQLEGFAQGVYLVRMTTDKGVIVKKIVR